MSNDAHALNGSGNCDAKRRRWCRGGGGTQEDSGGIRTSRSRSAVQGKGKARE